MTDFLVVGGGIAGAAAGYFLSRHGTVTLVEMEAAPGYHATGRSAALFSEYYGNPPVRALTAASRAFFTEPPDGFTEHPLLTPRGVVALCPPGAEELFEQALARGATAPVPAYEIGPDEVARHCPVVRRDWFTRALLRPAAADIDVDALHRGFLRAVTATGGLVLTRARVHELARDGGGWRARTSAGDVRAAVVVNAAGAWADEVAALAGVRPVGLVPRRRTAFLVDAPEDAGAWPMVCDVTETFYCKPESGALLVSPVDATPAVPGDARPDDLDVAIGLERLREATTLPARRVRHAWAGLRTSTPDDVPVVGPDPAADGFHWLAGLGGYGVQIAPAVGRALAEAVAGERTAITGMNEMMAAGRLLS
ncbi:FAD-dependent catabolic D-arginine dehydrogenase DauA [Catellatospora sp. TT07R-123]|uniref:NAD(P)/FAD-dependent oxidoreductase n=1 Tax=Catellatospora sp. TT07R-123 TaxID=2733863 RepID=UPI001B168E41|nr:FAD-binding oxidoreductase [Catellatospora sp. TT07R-123]GHJ48130.1 FAD-dependent catabolic D-arginine dehydrogenase DauA [Catellatospora sp. TT07R-123]